MDKLLQEKKQPAEIISNGKKYPYPNAVTNFLLTIARRIRIISKDTKHSDP